MKTKIVLFSILISVLSFTVASTKSAKNPKSLMKKQTSSESRVNKGLAMEDKNQFN